MSAAERNSIISEPNSAEKTSSNSLAFKTDSLVSEGVESSHNPLNLIQFEGAFHGLGSDYFDVARPAGFQELRLRWRNPELFDSLGIPLDALRDQHLLDAFGHFQPLAGAAHPPLAQRYIGFQFRVFNPHLGDGRGFLLGQVRARDGRLLDLGTKGSGQTLYSRGGDGRLTLKGGVREIIAAEFLHAMGTKTSRALTVIEHADSLWRGDEPSPTRASILVRLGESHVRFGTFERHYYLVQDPALKRRLLLRLADHVILYYYPELDGLEGADRYLALFERILQRCAVTTAHWIRAGFAHGVLNTDNMNVTGDSFDYGPFAFMETYDPEFTAAYFDGEGLYAFESQPDAVYWNLAMLTRPFSILAPQDGLEALLNTFPNRYRDALRSVMLPRLGFEDKGTPADRLLIKALFDLLRASGCHYHGFFEQLTLHLAEHGLPEGPFVLPDRLFQKASRPGNDVVEAFSQAWTNRLALEPEAPLPSMLARMREINPLRAPYRPEIERVWASITESDDWTPFYQWMERLRHPFIP